jgi:hypothetical protein
MTLSVTSGIVLAAGDADLVTRKSMPACFGHPLRPSSAPDRPS